MHSVSWHLLSRCSSLCNHFVSCLPPLDHNHGYPGAMNYWSEANQIAIPYARPTFYNRVAKASHTFQTMKLQCRQYHSISWVTEEV